MNCLDKVKVTNSGYLRVCHSCQDCKDTFADLPTENVEKDTIYFVRETELYYSWNGTDWVPAGGEFELGGSGGSGGGSVITIGENGNWYIDGEDTGKPSRGEQGEPGPKGDPGEKGDPGSTTASGTSFDDTVELNADNVQDAIVNLDEKVDLKTDYGYMTDASYYRTVKNGNITTSPIIRQDEIGDGNGGKSDATIYDVLGGHNAVLDALINNLSSLVIEEKKHGSGITVDAYAGADFTVNVAKTGYKCISASLRSTGNYNIAIVGGGLTNATTFTGSVKNVSNAKVYGLPLISCVYLKLP